MSALRGSNRFFPYVGDSGGGGGANLWTLYGGTVVGLTTLTDTVSIGAATMLADEKLRVVGGISSTPNGAAQNAFIEAGDGALSAVGTAASARFRYSGGVAQVSLNGAAYVDLLTGAPGSLAFIQNGNSFGADAVLGTNDAFALLFETSGVTRGRWTSAGELLVAAAAVSGSESLRVSGGGARIDGTQLIASVSSSLSLNNSGGPIQIGNNADAQAISIGTGAAARAITIGNTTSTSSIANSFGTNGFGLIQAAASGVTPVGVLMTAGAHTALPNVESTDVNFNLARTVTFSGGGAAITNQRAYRVQAPTYAAAAAQTITTASTLEISGQPVQGANVTLTAVGVTAGAYALNVATGNSRFGGSVFVRDTATGPGVQGLYSTDSSGNGFRVYQLSSTQTFWTNQGSTNTLVIEPAVAIQGTVLNPFSDGTIDLGGPGNRWRDLYTLRTQIKEHAAFTGSAQITGTGAVQTTNATVTTAYTSPSLLDNSSYWVEVWITARDTGSANRAMYQRLACIYRQAGGVATILTGTLAPVTVESIAGWDADIDVTGNTFRVRVTGALATTINWTCTVRYQGVSGNV